ncbi:MAG: NADH-quinone oxidoreductase subunit NuoE [Ahrensia sp.]|nr:NADH-quinone oxidoreductase subunit NuoE [Ahrensia sp.]
MSVRRLAEASVQPAEFAFTPAMAKEAEKWIGKYPEGREQSAVIPLLMLAQEQDGWVTQAAIEHVAERLDMAKIRVLEVATFYTQFMLAPVGTKAHVQVCGTTPCMLRGAEDLKKICQSKIHHDPLTPNADGTLSWEEVECQGTCVNAPMVMIGKDTYEDLTPERLEEIIDAFEAGKGDMIEPGPQVDRIYSAPEGGPVTLLDDESKTAASSAKRGKGNAPQKMTKAARPDPSAPEGDETLADPDEAEGPGRLEASKSGSNAKTNDAGPTLKVATTASGVKPKKKPAERAESGNSTLNVASTASVVSGARHEPLPEKRTKEPPRRDDSKKVKAKTVPEPQPEPKTYDESKPNPTMKLAATASGRAKAPARKAEATAAPSLDDGNRPAAMDKPDNPDDLKMISGVGPKIEGILHSLGIYKWEQIAGWKKAECDWIDGYLKFKGRIEREDWVKQATALATGGVDEYVRVFGKKPR